MGAGALDQIAGDPDMYSGPIGMQHPPLQHLNSQCPQRGTGDAHRAERRRGHSAVRDVIHPDDGQVARNIVPRFLNGFGSADGDGIIIRHHSAIRLELTGLDQLFHIPVGTVEGCGQLRGFGHRQAKFVHNQQVTRVSFIQVVDLTAAFEVADLPVPQLMQVQHCGTNDIFVVHHHAVPLLKPHAVVKHHQGHP